MASFSNFLTTPGTIFIDKTKYIELLDESKNYSYMFLRPRRFGKSTFMGTLCKYYDIAEIDSFQSLFGSLYIGKHPTKYRNSHLVLKLDLSTINISSDIARTERSFNKTVNAVLASFLRKYRRFLGDGWQLESILDEIEASISLQNVLVSAH